MKTHTPSSSEKTKMKRFNPVKRLALSVIAAAAFGLVYNSAKANLQGHGGA